MTWVTTHNIICVCHQMNTTPICFRSQAICQTQPFKECFHEHFFSYSHLSLIFQEMYKASKYEVSPDLKHVLLAYNVAPVSFSFVCLFFELANWQPNMSAASACVRGWGVGEEREKVIIARCEGLSHTAACQRRRRGLAQPSGTVAREAGTQTNPLRCRGCREGMRSTVWMRIYYWSAILK